MRVSVSCNCMHTTRARLHSRLPHDRGWATRYRLINGLTENKYFSIKLELTYTIYPAAQRRALALVRRRRLTRGNPAAHVISDCQFSPCRLACN